MVSSACPTYGDGEVWVWRWWFEKLDGGRIAKVKRNAILSRRELITSGTKAWNLVASVIIESATSSLTIDRTAATRSTKLGEDKFPFWFYTFTNYHCKLGRNCKLRILTKSLNFISGLSAELFRGTIQYLYAIRTFLQDNGSSVHVEFNFTNIY